MQINLGTDFGIIHVKKVSWPREISLHEVVSRKKMLKIKNRYFYFMNDTIVFRVVAKHVNINLKFTKFATLERVMATHVSEFQQNNLLIYTDEITCNLIDLNVLVSCDSMQADYVLHLIIVLIVIVCLSRQGELLWSTTVFSKVPVGWSATKQFHQSSK